MLNIKNLNKYYTSEKGEQYHALRDINLEIDDKGFVVILGKSGSGKSTLMNVIGGLDEYDSGEFIIKDQSTKELKGHEWDSYRNTYVGIVFQEFYIIEEYSVGKNIALALELQGYPKSDIGNRVQEILTQVDLDGHENRKPSEISGGQKQRIAIARALVKNPQIILADEPTGNLDSETGRLVLQTLKKLSKEKLVIMVTHDEEVASTYGNRIIEIKDGEVVSDEWNETQNSDHIVELEKQTIIKLPEDGKLNEQTILHIAQYIENQGKDVYLFMSKDDHHVNTIKPLQNKETKQIHIKDNSAYETFELKKSSLPFKHAFRLAINSLLTKKIRLGFITLLFTLSLAFVGVAASISLYDVAESSAKTFSNAGINYLPIQKQEYVCYKEIGDVHCADIPVNIKNVDIAELREKHPNLKYAKSYNAGILIPVDHEVNNDNLKNPYYKNHFSRLILLDENKEMFPLRHGEYPTNDEEILISDYMANMIVLFGNIEGVESLENVIDLKIPFRGDFESEGEEYKVVGIVKTDYDKFDHLLHETDSQTFANANYEELTTLYYQNIYMREETFTYKYSALPFRGGQFITGWFKTSMYATFIPTHESYEDFLIGDSRLPVANNEIVLPASAFKSLYQAREDVNIEDEYERIIGIVGDEFEISVRLPIRTVDNGIRVNRSYKIVGIYDDSVEPPIREKRDREWWSHWISTQEELEALDNLQLRIYSRALVLLDDNERENKKFIKDFDELEFKHQNEYSEVLYEVEKSTENIQRIFYAVGIFLALFTSFLIFSFISSSVKNKQKDIGTLRAIGARGLDVSKIFIIEGLIIAIAAAIFGTIAMTFGINQINDLITKGFDAALVNLYVNWLNISIVFALAVIIILIATFIPVMRIIRMKPIDAIKKIN